MTLVNELKRSYIDWLTQNLTFKEVDSNVIRIDTPFLDNDQDDVILYVEQTAGNRLMITDDGYTIDNLESMGLTINNRTKKKNMILDDIVKAFGVDFDQESKELFIETSNTKFAVAKHRLLQAVLRINDMANLRSDNIVNLFSEEIAKRLDEQEILYTFKFPALGRGGITFFFDFSIPGRNKKEKLVRTISHPNNLNSSKVLAMDASMLNGIRQADYFAILDDVNHHFDKLSEVEAIFSENTDVPIQPILYSEFSTKVKLLAN